MNETPSFNDRERNHGHPYRSLWLHEWYLSEPLVIMWCYLCFAILYKTRWALVSSRVITMLTIPLLPLLVLLSRWCVPASPWRSHLRLARRWWMPLHQEGPKNISPSSEEQIPLSNYPVTCQTFKWAWKLSLWSPCYRRCLCNPKVHHIVGSDYDTLMVWGTKNTC